MDATQWIDDDIDSIENSHVVNNEKSLQSSWDNLENNVEAEEYIEYIPDGSLTHSFTLVRAKKKKKKLKQASGYISRSKIDLSISLKWVVSFGIIGVWPIPPHNIGTEKNYYLQQTWFSFCCRALDVYWLIPSLPVRFLKLGYKLILVVNNRHNNFLNLWCFCKTSLNNFFYDLSNLTWFYTLVWTLHKRGLNQLTPNYFKQPWIHR